MGGIFTLPIVQVRDIRSTLSELNSTALVAAHTGTENVSVSEYRFDADTCILFGSEANGISPHLLEICTARVRIPMADGFDSLNVAASSAVFLHEARKSLLPHQHINTYLA